SRAARRPILSLPAPGAGAEQGQRGQYERHDRAARTAKLTRAGSAESATDGPNRADQALTSDAAGAVMTAVHNRKFCRLGAAITYLFARHSYSAFRALTTAQDRCRHS